MWIFDFFKNIYPTTTSQVIRIYISYKIEIKDNNSVKATFEIAYNEKGNNGPRTKHLFKLCEMFSTYKTRRHLPMWGHICMFAPMLKRKVSQIERFGPRTHPPAYMAADQNDEHRLALQYSINFEHAKETDNKYQQSKNRTV